MEEAAGSKARKRRQRPGLRKKEARVSTSRAEGDDADGGDELGDL